MKNGIFYGWWVIGALVLALTISSGTGFYCFGVFMEPVREDFGWTKAQVTWIITIYWIVSGLSSPVIGRLIDKYGVRKVMLSTAALNGACLLALGGVNTLWQFYLVYGVKAVAHAGIGLVSIGAIVSRWFVTKRGRATGIASTGIGLGGLFLAPFAGFMIPNFGWRPVYVILGVLLWLIVIPSIAIFVRSSPQEMGLLPDGQGNTDEVRDNSLETDHPAQKAPLSLSTGFSLSQALKTPTYWLVVGSFCFVPAAVFGTLAHQTAYLESIGISRAAASMALGFTAGMGILGKIFFGFLAEKLHIKYTTMLCFGIQALGVFILMMTKSTAMVWLFVIVFGFSMGGMAALQPLVIMEFFGTAAVGTILGSTWLGFSLGAATGPLYAAYIFDYFQSYYWAFLIYIIAYLCAIFMIFVAPMVKEPITEVVEPSN